VRERPLCAPVPNGNSDVALRYCERPTRTSALRLSCLARSGPRGRETAPEPRRAGRRRRSHTQLENEKVDMALKGRPAGPPPRTFPSLTSRLSAATFTFAVPPSPPRWRSANMSTNPASAGAEIGANESESSSPTAPRGRQMTKSPASAFERTVISGGRKATRVDAGTLSVTKTEPPTTQSAPTTVCPPRTLALA